MSDSPIALPTISPVYPPYTNYGYILLTAGQKTLRVVDSRIIEQVLTQNGIYAERLRFVTGAVVYRVPARFLSRCQMDKTGYFLAWGGARWQLAASDPSPPGSLGIWQPV